MSESHPPISLRPKKGEGPEENAEVGKASSKRAAKKGRGASPSGAASGDTSPQPNDAASSIAPGDRESEPIELSPDRRRERLPAPDARADPQPSEETAPFLLERSSPDLTAAAASAASEVPRAAGEVPNAVSGHVRLLRMARRLGVLVLLNALLYASIAVGGALRYAGDRTAIPEVVAAIIALGLTIWGTLAGYHLLHASRGKPNAGHQLAGAFSNFRSIFILKGTGLFLVLALSCFAFSAVLSLFALL